MANRPDDQSPTTPLPLLMQPQADPARADRERLQAEQQRAASRLEQARADLSRTARGTATQAGTTPASAAAATTHTAFDPTAIAARIDLMRARFRKAREDTISALLFLSDAQQDCDALAEAAASNRWPLLAAGVELLSQTLRRALPAESRHLDLIGLLIDALYALRRAETRPDMGRAGEDLLRGLRLTVGRELPLNNA